MVMEDIVDMVDRADMVLDKKQAGIEQKLYSLPLTLIAKGCSSKVTSRKLLFCCPFAYNPNNHNFSSFLRFPAKFTLDIESPPDQTFS